MSGMTGDLGDRILALLGAGPAGVADLAGRLEAPGGVVSYQLKILEQAGLARVGAERLVRGVRIPVYVSTAAAAAVPAGPAALPGLTRVAGGRFPIPLWTVDEPRAASDPGSTAAGVPTTAGPSPMPAARSDARPRLVDVRRIPVDDATFYEFAIRLHALAEEFAGRATPGAPTAELAVTLHRPPGDDVTVAGRGS